jgi:fructokinase
MSYYGGIEAGGTKFVCAIGTSDGKIVEEKVIPTEHPDKTMKTVIDFFGKSKHRDKVASLGLGAFGPLDSDPNSPTFGYITSTPKIEWQDYPIVSVLQERLHKKVHLVTDVEAAALGEYYYGEGMGKKNIVYMTIGTGIGGASVVQGKLLPMQGHQEMGHMRIPHDKTVDAFEGLCEFHKDCLEGIASGSAMKARFEVTSAMHLPANHKAWELEADYLASALMNIILLLSPEKIILGGGVMKQQHLLEKIHYKVIDKINRYVQVSDVVSLIVTPGLADRSGVMGCLALAYQFEKEEKNHVN